MILHRPPPFTAVTSLTDSEIREQQRLKRYYLHSLLVWDASRTEGLELSGRQMRFDISLPFDEDGE